MVPMIQESFEKTARIFQATCYSKFRLQVFHQSHSHIFLRGETTDQWDSINSYVKRKMPKLYKIKLVKQQSFNFSHNLL